MSRNRTTSIRGTQHDRPLPPAIKAREEAEAKAREEAKKIDPSKIKLNPTLKQTIAEEVSKRPKIVVPKAVSPETIFQFESLAEGFTYLNLKGDQVSTFRTTPDGEHLVSYSIALYLYFQGLEDKRICFSSEEFHLKASVDSVINHLYSIHTNRLEEKIPAPKTTWDNW